MAGSTETIYNQSLTSPRRLFYGTSCLSLDVAKVHLHPYSASFLLISSSYSSSSSLLEINDFSLLNSSWQRQEVTIYNYYSGASLIFSATTFHAYVAIDNVNIKYGMCSSGKQFVKTFPYKCTWCSFLVLAFSIYHVYCKIIIRNCSAVDYFAVSILKKSENFFLLENFPLAVC